MTITGPTIYRQDTPNIAQGAPRIHQGSKNIAYNCQNKIYSIKYLLENCLRK